MADIQLFQEKENEVAFYICKKLYHYFVSPAVDNIIEQKIRENNDKHAEHFITKNQLKVYKETIIQEIEKKTDLKMEVLSTDVNKRILNNIQESMNRLLRS